VPTLKRNELQETNNHPTQLTITNKFDALGHAETEGNTEHKTKDQAPPPIFVSRITNMQRLTATIEQAVYRSNYTLNIINNDAMKIITNKSEYHKTIIDILKEEKVNSTHTNLGNNVRTEW
jgi:50S ribosomal subunit-associated GTPase HflX